MREIKFRAWNTETKTMVDLEKITPLALSETMNSQMAMQGMRGVFIPFREGMVIEQFTGLLDKNGKEIYEGDIVKGVIASGRENIEKPYLTYVKFDDGCFVLHLEEGAWLPCLTEVSFRRIEIIGNIHENPELLK